MLHEHGVIPFVQIDPTDASVAAIAAGAYDDYLRTYADSVRDFGHAVVIGFGHEMNAPWYSWGYGHVPPSTFVAAWRHIVTLFRERGRRQRHLAVDAPGGSSLAPGRSPPGGRARSTSPGSASTATTTSPSDTFASVFGQTIDQVRAFTGKPILLSETAVGPDAGQFAKIQDLFHGMATVQDARAGLVRQGPARRHRPPGLADRRQPAGQDLLPAGRAQRTGAKPSRWLAEDSVIMSSTQIRQTSHTGTSAAVCSLILSTSHGPIGGAISPFPAHSGKSANSTLPREMNCTVFVGSVLRSLGGPGYGKLRN